MSKKKIESEIIIGSYMYEQVRRGVMIGTEEALIDFETLREALIDSMIRMTFDPANIMIDYHILGKTIELNAVGAGILLMMENILTDYGLECMATLSTKLSHTVEGVVGAATNVRRIDIIDDEMAADDQKHTISLTHRIMAEIVAGQSGWKEKAWEAWFAPFDEPVIFGAGGEVQHSPITEDQVQILLWTITHVMEANHLYKVYHGMQEKLEGAINAANKQFDHYDSLIEDSADGVERQYNRIHTYAGKSLAEVQAVYLALQDAKTSSKELASDLIDGPLKNLADLVDRAEDVMLNLNTVLVELNKKSDTIKGQTLVLDRKLNKADKLFLAAGINIDEINSEFGIGKPKRWERIVQKIPIFKIITPKPRVFNTKDYVDDEVTTLEQTR